MVVEELKRSRGPNQSIFPCKVVSTYLPHQQVLENSSTKQEAAMPMQIHGTTGNFGQWTDFVWIMVFQPGHIWYLTLFSAHRYDEPYKLVPVVVYRWTTYIINVWTFASFVGWRRSVSILEWSCSAARVRPFDTACTLFLAIADILSSCWLANLLSWWYRPDPAVAPLYPLLLPDSTDSELIFPSSSITVVQADCQADLAKQDTALTDFDFFVSMGVSLSAKSSSSFLAGAAFLLGCCLVHQTSFYWFFPPLFTHVFSWNQTDLQNQILSWLTMMEMMVFSFRVVQLCWPHRHPEFGWLYSVITCIRIHSDCFFIVFFVYDVCFLGSKQTHKMIHSWLMTMISHPLEYLLRGQHLINIPPVVTWRWWIHLCEGSR